MKRLIFCLMFIVLALCGITHAISTKPSDTDVVPEPPPRYQDGASLFGL
jgi:hypothetical protein